LTVKVKINGNKAIVRFNKQVDAEYFTWVMAKHRDDKQEHPPITIKRNGENVPKMQPYVAAPINIKPEVIDEDVQTVSEDGPTN